MKKIFLILPILLSVSSVFATMDCAKNGFSGSCGSGGYFVPNDQDGYRKYLINKIYKSFPTETTGVAWPDNVIHVAKEKIKELEDIVKDYNQLKPLSMEINNDTNCKKITNKLWIGKSDANTNGDVTRLQKFLKSIGMIDWDSDGKYGTWDRRAVWKFQEIYMPNISPTGDVGNLTIAKINGMICSNSNTYPEVSWEFGSNLGDNINKIANVKIVSSDGSVKNTTVTVRQDCYVTNSENTGKSTKPENAFKSWLACEGWDGFTNYYVVSENDKFIIKTTPVDMSGLERYITTIVKQID